MSRNKLSNGRRFNRLSRTVVAQWEGNERLEIKPLRRSFLESLKRAHEVKGGGLNEIAELRRTTDARATIAVVIEGVRTAMEE